MISARQETCKFVHTSIKALPSPRFIQRTAERVGGFLGGAEEKGDKTNDAFHRVRRVDFEIFFVPVWHLSRMCGASSGS